MVARAEQEPKPKLSLEIRIGESTLYDHAPGMRAVLKEIAIMTSAPGSEKKPKSDGFDPDLTWAGWCWPQEKTLAARTGNCERLVRKAVHRFQAEGVVEIRTWRDSAGRPHNAYRIREEVVDAAQRRPGEDRKRASDRKANATSFKSHRNGDESAIEPQSHRNAEPRAIGTLSHEPQEREPRKPQELDAVEVGLVRGMCLEVGDGGGFVRGEASDQIGRGDQNRAPNPGAHIPLFESSTQIQKQPSVNEAIDHLWNYAGQLGLEQTESSYVRRNALGLCVKAGLQEMNWAELSFRIKRRIAQRRDGVWDDLSSSKYFISELVKEKHEGGSSHEELELERTRTLVHSPKPNQAKPATADAGGIGRAEKKVGGF